MNTEMISKRDHFNTAAEIQLYCNQEMEDVYICVEIVRPVVSIV